MSTPEPATEPEPRLLAITAVVSTNFGDHGEMCRTAVRYVEGETVEDLMRRALPGLSQKWRTLAPEDHIVIQVIPPSVPPKPDEPDPWKLDNPAPGVTPF